MMVRICDVEMCVVFMIPEPEFKHISQYKLYVAEEMNLPRIHSIWFGKYCYQYDMSLRLDLQMERPLPSIDVIFFEAGASVNGTCAIAGSILTCHG